MLLGSPVMAEGGAIGTGDGKPHTSSPAISCPASSAGRIERRSLGISFTDPHLLMQPKPVIASSQSTLQTYNMLEWMILDTYTTQHMDGTHPIYTFQTAQQPDKFYYLKSSTGNPWDINLYDDDYIYGWITETDLCDGCQQACVGCGSCTAGSCGVSCPWTDAYSFKKAKYDTNLPIMPRTVTGGYPGTVLIPSNTEALRYKKNGTACDYCDTIQLGGVRMELWGPYNIQMWGDIGSVDVLKVTYWHGCSDTSNPTTSCQFAEVNWYAEQYGWVRWALYKYPNWSTPDQESIFNEVVDDQVQPVPNFPCF